MVLKYVLCTEHSIERTCRCLTYCMCSSMHMTHVLRRRMETHNPLLARSPDRYHLDLIGPTNLFGEKTSFFRERIPVYWNRALVLATLNCMPPPYYAHSLLQCVGSLLISPRAEEFLSILETAGGWLPIFTTPSPTFSQSKLRGLLRWIPWSLVVNAREWFIRLLGSSLKLRKCKRLLLKGSTY